MLRMLAAQRFRDIRIGWTHRHVMDDVSESVSERASISRPRTARVSRSSRAVAVFAVARVDVSRQLNGRPTRRGREGATQGPYGRRCPFDCTGAGRTRPTVVSDRDTGRMVASRRARQHVFDITPRFDRQTAPAMPCLGIASPISIFRLLSKYGNERNHCRPRGART